MAETTEPAILLVEDDRLTRVVVRDSLRQCGFKVDIAENGQVAMDKLSKARKRRSLNYGLILTDIYMPKVNGEELVSQLQRSDKYRHIPVAVMSSNDEAQTARRCLSNGAAEFLVKPVSKTALNKLHSLLRAAQASAQHAALAATQDTPLAVFAEHSPEVHSPTHSPRRWGRGEHASSPAKFAPEDGSSGSDASQNTDNEMRVNGANASGSGSNASPAILTPGARQESTSQQGAMQLMLAALQSDTTMATPAAVTAAAPAAVPVAAARSPARAAASSARAAAPAAAAESLAVQSLNAKFPTLATAASSTVSRRGALARFRSKKAARLSAPKVRYVARKKLAEGRPRYKGQFIKRGAAPPPCELDLRMQLDA